MRRIFMHRFEWMVGLGYLFSERKKSFLTLTTFISIGGVASGVLALTIVISVMNGFSKDIRQKVIGFKSHILIEAKDFLPFTLDKALPQKLQDKDKRIMEVTPHLSVELMAKFRQNISGILYKGVDLPILRIQKDDSPILLGEELSATLRVKEGDTIEIVSPLETMGPLGTIPKMKKYRVAGLLKTGLYEYDTKLAIVPLSEAQRFLELKDRVSGIEIKILDLDEVDPVIQNISKLVSHLQVRGWPELNQKLFSAIKLEKM